MKSPIESAWNFLRGADLQTPATAAPEKKAFTWPDPGALITPPTVIVSGPAQFMVANPAADASDMNSAVFSCLLALAMAHIEPLLKVYRGDPESRTAEWLDRSPMQALLTRPNPELTALELFFWTAWAKHTDGNAYWKKVRSGDELQGNVIELWPISPRLIKPVTEPGSSRAITYYRHTVAPGKYEDIAPENVVHFRLGLDSQDVRLGLSPIKRLVREIASDQAATQFTDALLRNYGVPGLVVEVPPGAALSDEQAEDLKRRMENRFGNENRGNVGVLSGGATVRQFGFSPEQLNMKSLHETPEARIAATMGVPPAVAGLTVGLEQTSNYASLKQVREAFTELTCIPNWRMDAAVLNARLKPDFTDDPEVVVGYDLSRVRALQEDRTALFSRLDNAVRTGWVTPNEARGEVGLEPVRGGDVPMPTPAAGFPASGALAPLPSAKASGDMIISLKAGEALTPEAFMALVELGAPALEKDLEDYFSGQRRRAARALTRPPESKDETGRLSD